MKENRYVMLNDSLNYLKELTGYIKNGFNKLKEKIEANPRQLIIYSIPPALFASIGFVAGYNSSLIQQDLNLSKELAGLLTGVYGSTVPGGAIDLIISELKNPINKT